MTHAELTRNDTSAFWERFDRLDRWLLQLERLGMWLAAVAIVVTFLVMIGAVLTRPWTGYLFSLGVEGGKMGLWPIGFLPAAYLWRRYGHVRFDLVLRAVSFRTAQRLELANCVVVFILAVLMTISAWSSYADVFNSKTRTLTMHLQYWPIFWCAVAGSAMLAVELLFAAIRHWREAREPTGGEQAPWHLPSEGEGI